ncbi:MAG: peptide-methionine (S)-S-oxide reductase MsrA [Proteobacteria bacterium]|nr:peptide-methionine (S)-S-oxide reductase MsrA [Pseudomonadota bacterium]
MKNIIGKILFTILIITVQTASAEKTILAGGCFWCMEADFETLEGVSDVISGFSGGSATNPTYRGDHTGHYEVVQITYDAAVVSYQGILDHFWVNIDPFDDRGQFCDKGPSYLSAIFVASNEQRAIAEKSRQAVIDMFPDQTVVTPILDQTTFFPIKGEESYHQDYYVNSPIRYKYYRWGCGRDKRLKQIWGDRATH